MSLHMTCDHCGHTSETSDRSFYQIHLQDITDASKPNLKICLCSDCLPDYILAQAEPVPIKKSVSDDTRPEHSFIGKPLRDYLNSELYRKTHNVLFCDAAGRDITSFLTWLDKSITDIKYPTESCEFTYVYLDT